MKVHEMEREGYCVLYCHIDRPGTGRTKQCGIYQELLYREECLSEAKGCSNIHFLGWMKSDSHELKSAYANAEIVVLPSYYETFGLAAIEGASYGAKIVLSKTLPINDFNVFDKCPKIDPNNINDIKCKLLKAISEEKESLFLKKIKSTFSWDNIIDEHINIYKRL